MEISHISFPMLTKVAIWKNSIESVEVLHRIDLPQLEWINLGMSMQGCRGEQHRLSEEHQEGALAMH